MSEFCHSGIILKLVSDSFVYAIEIFFNLNSKEMKNLNFSPRDLRLSKFSELKLCLSLITKMYRNSYLIGWL